MNVPNTHLPRWDLTAIFPSLDSPELTAVLTMLAASLDDVEAIITDVTTEEGAGHTKDAAAAFDRMLLPFNDLLRLSWTVESYLYGSLTVDSHDALAGSRWSAFQRHKQRVRSIKARFIDWLGTLDIECLTVNSDLALEHEFLLQRALDSATHRMPIAEELLAAELTATNAAAWQKLHGDIWSRLRCDVVIEGEQQSLPMSATRLLAQHPDRGIRETAHNAELHAWERASLPLSAAFNSVNGHALTLSEHRGWDSLLDVACFANQIDRASLDAMLRAVRDSLPEFRRYLQAKARVLGLPSLAWHDLYAPVGETRRVWEYDDARTLILREFTRFSPRLHDLAARAFDERWIDAAPRGGKQGGGLCLEFPDGTSRITLTYTSTFMGIRQLAHELGHAYHNLALVEAGRSMWQWSLTPNTLAETAAIFCEALVREAVLDDASSDDQLFILDATLQNTCRFIVEGLASYEFEERFFDLRRTRELSVAELNTLALECQRETFGDALDSRALHPYMWATRPHAFVPETSHAAIPYMFGQLFSASLFARYQAQPDRFRAEFDTLLASASTTNILSLAARLDMDLHDNVFWQSSIDMIRRDINHFEESATKRPTRDV